MLRLVDDRDAMEPLAFAGNAFQDIGVLAAMYLLGSPTWTRAEVVAEMRRSIERIHSTPGFEPWTENAAPAWAVPAEPAPKKRWWQRG